jgi:hypothetical protein
MIFSSAMITLEPVLHEFIGQPDMLRHRAISLAFNPSLTKSNTSIWRGVNYCRISALASWRLDTLSEHTIENDLRRIFDLAGCNAA